MNIVKIRAPDADEWLNASGYGAGALLRLESSPDGIAAYAEIATKALVAGTYLYTLFDSTGTDAALYRWRPSNAGNTVQGDYTAVIAGPWYGLCLLEDVRLRLKKIGADVAQDEELLQFILQVTADIQTYTERVFTPDPVTGTKIYTFDGWTTRNHGYILPIKRGIRSVSLLRLKSLTNDAAGFVTVPVGNYFLRPSLVDLKPGWPAEWLLMTDIPTGTGTWPTVFMPGYDTVEVTGAFGFAAVPSDIEGVALSAVVTRFKARGSVGGQFVNVGADGEMTFLNTLSFDDRATLRRYRIPKAG